MDKKWIAFCGNYCETCEWKDKMNCQGCKASKSQMFWGQCDKAKCCMERGFEHCGHCPELPCQKLIDMFNDPEHGDHGKGTKLTNLKNWASGMDTYEKT